MAMNTITGRSAFLSLLEAEGVTHLFGNPGTTELPIMHALKDHPDLTYVLGLQESLVVAMADGFSRASGKLTACNVHVAPGLGNAIGSIFNAKFTGSPIIITAGQQEQGHGLTEPLLYDTLVPIAAPVVKWAIEVTRLDDLPRIVHRAAKIATSAPTGPVFISLPGDILNAEGGIDLGHPTRVDNSTRPSDATLNALVRRLLAAERPAIIAGPEVVTADAMDRIAGFADALGAPVWQQTIPYGAHYPSEHRAFMGALTRIQREVRAALEPHDLLVFVGADVLRMSVYSEIDPLPAEMPIIQIGLNDWELGKNYPAEMAIRANVRDTLDVLIPAIETEGGPAHAERAKARLDAAEAQNWTVKRAAKRARIEERAGATPMSGDWMSMQVADAIPRDGMIVNEGLTSSFGLIEMLPYHHRYSYHGNASGGIGWAIPGAIGIHLAQPDRPLVAIVGDGSAMYSIQALYTAARMKLPITYVIANNKSYRIIKQRLLAFHGDDNYVGMDFTDPEIDFVGLARSLGLEAERITEPDALRPALDAAIASAKPTLLDVIVDGSF